MWSSLVRLRSRWILAVALASAVILLWMVSLTALGGKYDIRRALSGSWTSPAAVPPAVCTPPPPDAKAVPANSIASPFLVSHWTYDAESGQISGYDSLHRRWGSLQIDNSPPAPAPGASPAAATNSNSASASAPVAGAAIVFCYSDSADPSADTGLRWHYDAPSGYIRVIPPATARRSGGSTAAIPDPVIEIAGGSAQFGVALKLARESGGTHQRWKLEPFTGRSPAASTQQFFHIFSRADGPYNLVVNADSRPADSRTETERTCRPVIVGVEFNSAYSQWVQHIQSKESAVNQLHDLRRSLDNDYWARRAEETPDHGLSNDIYDYDRGLFGNSGTYGPTREDSLRTIRFPPIPKPLTAQQFDALPRLAVVSFITADAGFKESISLSAMSCYCAQWGLPFYIETARLHALTNSNVHFNKVRAMQKYLRYFQWILFVDGDVVPHNRSADLRSFLDDRFMIISAERMNGESWPNPFIRNTPEMHVILQRWMNYSYAGIEPNGDNGPYLDLLLRLVAEDEYVAAGCDKLLISDYYKHAACYQKILRGRREFPPYWKWYRPQTGYMRASEKWPNTCFDHLLPGDVLGHGKGRKMFTTWEDAYCVPINGDTSVPRLYPQSDADWNAAREKCLRDGMSAEAFVEVEQTYRVRAPPAALATPAIQPARVSSARAPAVPEVDPEWTPESKPANLEPDREPEPEPESES